MFGSTFWTGAPSSSTGTSNTTPTDQPTVIPIPLDNNILKKLEEETRTSWVLYWYYNTLRPSYLYRGFVLQKWAGNYNGDVNHIVQAQPVCARDRILSGKNIEDLTQESPIDTNANTYDLRGRIYAPVAGTYTWTVLFTGNLSIGIWTAVEATNTNNANPKLNGNGSFDLTLIKGQYVDIRIIFGHNGNFTGTLEIGIAVNSVSLNFDYQNIWYPPPSV